MADKLFGQNLIVLWLILCANRYNASWPAQATLAQQP